ncbi:hypothetical protein GCM10025868_01940 [Angustibacter aerolatus]|uniref:Uncharacterized protein n=1 Tax=Angustibacter aerolatus TaxID=1162965 RepID=A0ABQ6JAX8_9ACTN|nr:hypothetical protein GCM10025868_01940 [Angustibacter aerolatus]
MTPSGPSEALPKRRAILRMVHALAESGVPVEALASALPGSKFRSVPGVLTGEELWQAFRTRHQQAEERRKRWFLDEPVHSAEETWVLFSNWGLNTETVLEALVALRPDAVSFRAADRRGGPQGSESAGSRPSAASASSTSSRGMPSR